MVIATVLVRVIFRTANRIVIMTATMLVRTITVTIVAIKIVY